MRSPRSTVILPQARSCTASIAPTPYRVDSTRSNAVGVPPRCTWPSCTTRVSKPVRSPIASAIRVADAAEQHVSEPVVRPSAPSRACRASVRRPRRRRRSTRSGRARGGACSRLAEFVDVEGDLGDQHRGGAAGDARVGGDPARVAAHHLDDHHPVVALGGGVQSVDRVGRDLDGGVEAERHVGADDVVVDRLRHADDRQSVFLVQPAGDAERAVAADHDQRRRCRGRRTSPRPARPLRRRRTGSPGGFRARFRPAAACRASTRPSRSTVRRSSTPSHASRNPIISSPWIRSPMRTTARMTAFRPGQSPPPVRIPTRTPERTLRDRRPSAAPDCHPADRRARHSPTVTDALRHRPRRGHHRRADPSRVRRRVAERRRVRGVHAALPAAGLGRARRRRDLGGDARTRRLPPASMRPRSAPKRSRRSASPTSARRCSPGTDRPASRTAPRSCGRTVAPPSAATSSPPPATCPLVRERTGLVLDPYFSGTKVEWLLAEPRHPDRRRSRDRHHRLVADLEPDRRRGVRHRRVQRQPDDAVRHPHPAVGPRAVRRSCTCRSARCRRSSRRAAGSV